MEPLFLSERVDQPWRQYGYDECDVLWKGKKLPYKVIMRNGVPVTIVSDAYRLIPLEYAEEVAQELARRLDARLVRREYSYVTLRHPAEPVKVPLRIWLVYDLPGEEYQVGEHRIRFSYTVTNSLDATRAFQIMLTNVLNNRTYVLVPSRWTTAITPAEVAAFIREVHAGKKALDPVDQMVERAHRIIEEGQKILPFLTIWAETQADDELIEMVKKKLPKIYLPPGVKEAGVRTYMTLLDLYVGIAEKIWQSSRIGIDRRYQLFATLHSIFRAKSE